VFNLWQGEWFPMDENNCPPLQLVTTFCQSAYKYLKAGLENVVVVHCKGGMAHAGLMISCLLLYLKVFATSLQFSQIVFNQSLLGYGNDLLKILSSAKQLRSIVWCVCVFLQLLLVPFPSFYQDHVWQSLVSAFWFCEVFPNCRGVCESLQPEAERGWQRPDSSKPASKYSFIMAGLKDAWWHFFCIFIRMHFFFCSIQNWVYIQNMHFFYTFFFFMLLLLL